MRGQHPGHYIVSYDSELATSFVGLLRVVALVSSREDGNDDVSHSFQSPHLLCELRREAQISRNHNNQKGLISAKLLLPNTFPIYAPLETFALAGKMASAASSARYRCWFISRKEFPLLFSPETTGAEQFEILKVLHLRNEVREWRLLR